LLKKLSSIRDADVTGYPEYQRLEQDCAATRGRLRLERNFRESADHREVLLF
jgi:hypothetical protein